MLFASHSAISGSFHSLFKVLCTFPSWYLFAIGLKFTFSFGCNLPPTLRSTSKERDSHKSHRTQRLQMVKGSLTLHGTLFQAICTRFPESSDFQDYNSKTNFDWHAELFHFHSPLLKESWLVPPPPLSYMLKFSGFADLTSCP